MQSESLEKLKRFLGDYELVVLDEAQRVKNIGLNLKIIHDHLPHIQVIATGSSSFDLSNQINEPLTGRALDYMLYPLAFEELLTQHDQHDLSTKLEHMLRFGLYPDVFHRNQEDAETMLSRLASSALYKDILEFETLKKSDQLVDILQLLSLQIGHQVSYNEIGQQLGLNIATVQRYVDLLTKSFVIFKLRGFSRNLRKEIHKSVKIYFWDLGIRNALIRNFNPLHLRNDTGALWENFFIAERLKYLNNNQHFVNTYFWRTYDQKEIDYVEESGGELRTFECKWNPKKKVKEPKEFMQTYDNASFNAVTPENFWKFLKNH